MLQLLRITIQLVPVIYCYSAGGIEENIFTFVNMAFFTYVSN